jgi:hypothetical protein
MTGTRVPRFYEQRFTTGLCDEYFFGCLGFGIGQTRRLQADVSVALGSRLVGHSGHNLFESTCLGFSVPFFSLFLVGWV